MRIAFIEVKTVNKGARLNFSEKQLIEFCKKILLRRKDIFQIPLTFSIDLLSMRMWFERWCE